MALKDPYTMRTLVHITDIHFGKLTAGAMETMEARIAEINPDICTVGGDFTMRSRPREWMDARALIERLPGVVLAVPGNHDLPYVNLWERFRHPYRRFKRYIHENPDPSYMDDEIAVMGINTARPWVPHYTWKEGAISDAQAAAAGRFFRQAGANRFKIVFAHHPFLPPPDQPRTYLVRNAPAALSVFEDAGVDMILGGHLHLAYSGDIASFHTHIRRPMRCIQGPTVTSSRLRDREPNGFFHLCIEAGRAETTTWQWTGSGFEPRIAENRGTIG